MNDPADSSPLEDLISGRPSSARQRRIMWIVVMAAFVALAVLLLRFLTGHDSSYISERVTRGNLEPRLMLGGEIYSADTVDVGMPFAGTVAQVLVTEGARVEQGQPLARIDASDTRLVFQEGQAAITAARADIKSASASRAQADAKLARIEDVYRRSKGRVPSRQELDEARSDARARAADLDGARARLAEAEARSSAAGRDLSRTVIRSPIDGFVVGDAVRSGELVAEPGRTLFVVSPNVERMRIDVMVPQAMIADLRRGTRARLTASSMPERRFEAWVHDIATVPSGGSSAFRVTLVVINREKRLRRGMRGTVEIGLRSRNNVLLVPNSAFHFEPATKRAPSERNDGQETIYTLNGHGGIDPVAVSAGSTDGVRTQVHSNALKDGDLVAVGWRVSPVQDGPAD